MYIAFHMVTHLKAIYGASPAMLNHTVLKPALTPGKQAGTRFTFSGGMEG